MRFPIAGIITAILAAFVGVVIAVTAQVIMQSTIPAPVTVLNVKVWDVGGRPGERWMDIDIHAPYVQSCTRSTYHLIYRPLPPLADGKPRRRYAPLASAGSSSKFPGSVENFTATIQLPPGLPSGEWFYVDRSIFTCVAWPGLSRITANESAPVKIVLSDTGGG